MANSRSQQIDVWFEKLIETVNAMNLFSKTATPYKMEANRLSQAGQTIYRPMEFMTQTVDGRDMSSSYKDVVALTVPATLSESHFRNVPHSFTGVDLNDKLFMDRSQKAAAKKLANRLDTLVADYVGTYATQLVVNSGNIDTYDDLAEAETIFLEQQLAGDDDVMLLNPRMAKNVLGVIAGKSTMNNVSVNAYEQSKLLQVGNFATYRADYMKSITGSSGTGYTVDGGSQGHTPDNVDNNGIPVDNRTQTLTVADGSGAQAGDFFTMAGVYSVGALNKQSTGQLKTFRILAVNSSTSWTIAPAIIPANGTGAQIAYANCSNVPANDAEISILNTTTKACSTFFKKSAVELLHADFDVSSFADTGKKVRYDVTDSGVGVVLLSDSNIDTLVTKYRLMVWANPNATNYEMLGALLEGQA